METYYGTVSTQEDAIKLFEASRLGLLQPLDSKLLLEDIEKIQLGIVFVWSDKKIRIKRWLDKRKWSGVRGSRGFLIYNELEYHLGLLRHKPDGLVKQTFTRLHVTGQRFRLISYLAASQLSEANLMNPSVDQTLKDIPADKTNYHTLRAIPSAYRRQQVLLNQHRVLEPAIETRSLEKSADNSFTNHDLHFFLYPSLALNHTTKTANFIPAHSSPMEKKLSPTRTIDEALDTEMMCSQTANLEIEFWDETSGLRL
jgi:hypothetical protein